MTLQMVGSLSAAPLTPCLLSAARYNTHVVVNPAGELAASYRKVHLFDVDVPQGPVLMESRTTAPGDQVGREGVGRR
jgi:predicted amidohydrolase